MVSQFSSSSSCSSDDVNNIHEINLDEDTEWNDLERDEEKMNLICFFEDDHFDNVLALLQHCKDVHGLDIVKLRSDLGVYVSSPILTKDLVADRYNRSKDIDFLQTIKLVNYIRTEVRRGNRMPDISNAYVFDDDQYLRPVVEDDAVLYNLEDILGPLNGLEKATPNGISSNLETEGSSLHLISGLQNELHCVQEKFQKYQQTVMEVLEKEWDSENPVLGSSSQPGQRPKPLESENNDIHYFSSYSKNDIHETMLKDTVRTDAYRDFIYENKDIFKDKVILDVGCGTGILSMFCARAGAAKVFAVDNSDIIYKAQEIVVENGLGGIVNCLRGKIEEVTLPVSQVDVIVSEWMGYCLLYEAMLDSVLWARDRYLSSDGLIIPSHVTLHVAPFADPDYIADNISFWRSVYGFKMSSMLSHIYDDVYLESVKPSSLPADSAPFLQLALQSAKLKDLTFSKKPFRLQLNQDTDSLDGFLIWFDTFFLGSREQSLPLDARAEVWTQDSARRNIAFTTGPSGPETHWRQGLLLIDHGKKAPPLLKKGQVILGEIGYQRREDNQREVDIAVRWDIPGSWEKGKQVWSMH